ARPRARAAGGGASVAPARAVCRRSGWLIQLPPASRPHILPRAWAGTGRAAPPGMTLRSASWLAMTCLALAACAGDDSAGEDAEDGFVVEDGKADNYFSVKAKEFVVTGTARVTVEAGQGEARAKRLIPLQHVAITWFLNQYLVDKETGEHGDANADYGGFAAMVKNGAYSDLNLKQINAT